ncbi:MAG: ABC transporter ATP-binding protein [Tissierellia bacterium]|nr:ABC transporter ATP-binding protein [Tissierellia bacterium]
MEKLIEMNGIVKEFPGVRAIDGGHFDLYPGEIHSLIGENGAGKSSMMKVIYGLYPAEEGEIILKGERLDHFTTKDVIERGVGMVHQEFMLVNDMTVLENIILGFEPIKSMDRLDFAEAARRINEYVHTYGLDIQLNKKVKDISMGEAQRVEIIKTLYRGADLLILDEPTAVLTPQETVKLFEILDNLRKDNKSIVFISHKLNEVMEISDRITVMRQGKYIDTVEAAKTSEVELARMMVGRDVFLDIKRIRPELGEVVLSIEDVYVPGEREISKIRGLSLQLHKGEVLGIAGIDGNGQAELIEAITGLREVEKGRVVLNGQDISNKKVREIREIGLSHIPEDRNKRGLNRRMSIQENLIGLNYDKPTISKGLFVDKGKARSYSENLISKFDIRPANPDASTQFLSGGNAQKIVVAREIDQHSPVLIASQPTRGVDIGAIEFIRSQINEQKTTGTGIILVSADLQEILSLSDTIAVMFEGRITGIMDRSEANEDNLGMLMAGGTVA